MSCQVLALNLINSLVITNDLTIAPKLKPHFPHQSQSEGSYFQQFCSVQKGSEPFFFNWHRNGDVIKSGPDLNYKIENSKRSSTLTIERIERKDSANYSCIVQNGFGSDSQNVLLSVEGIVNNLFLQMIQKFCVIFKSYYSEKNQFSFEYLFNNCFKCWIDYTIIRILSSNIGKAFKINFQNKKKNTKRV